MAARELDAVLPLRRRDQGRFTILDRSLRRHVRDLRVCWVVTPDAEHGELERTISGDLYRVIPESSVVPEVAAYRRLHRMLRATGVAALLGGRYDAAGWFTCCAAPRGRSTPDRSGSSATSPTSGWRRWWSQRPSSSSSSPARGFHRSGSGRR